GCGVDDAPVTYARRQGEKRRSIDDCGLLVDGCRFSQFNPQPATRNRQSRAPSAFAAGASAPSRGGSGSLLISSFSSLPGLKYGTRLGGTSTLSPVLGLRPLRGSRWRRRKLPNPRSSILSPRCSASTIVWKTVSTMTSECFFVRSDTRE